MKKVLFVFASVCILISCQKEPRREERTHARQEMKKHDRNVSERFLRLDGKIDTLRSYSLGKNLFGKFHQERAEFYIIENPNKTIYNHPVKSITLYFLDGMLAKTKYALEEDISDQLIHSYGNFTIKGYDSLTRKIFKTEKIVEVVNDEKILNKKLNNYELKWDLNNKYIFVRVDKSGPKKRFEYIEALKNFESKYKYVERSAW